MKVAVLGAGAMGSFFGARLAESGADVILIDVNAAHIEAVRRDGLRLVTDDGDRQVPVSIGTAASFSNKLDLLIVFTKAIHTVKALASVTHLMDPDTCALTLQNGLDNGDRIASAVARDRILIGMTTWPADLHAPGHVISHGAGEVRLWRLEGEDTSFPEAVRALLDQAGLNCQLDPQVDVAIWEKVAFNAAMNSIAAVTGFTVGEMADDPGIRGLAHGVIEETVQVAQACGVAASLERIDAALQGAFTGHRAHKPSMLQDVLAGRPTEIDAINGRIVERARAAGIQVPVVETLARLVRAQERRAGVGGSG
jgi:2-dehydropantoate 2-reductase